MWTYSWVTKIRSSSSNLRIKSWEPPRFKHRSMRWQEMIKISCINTKTSIYSKSRHFTSKTLFWTWEIASALFSAKSRIATLSFQTDSSVRLKARWSSTSDKSLRKIQGQPEEHQMLIKCRFSSLSLETLTTSSGSGRQSMTSIEWRNSVTTRSSKTKLYSSSSSPTIRMKKFLTRSQSIFFRAMTASRSTSIRITHTNGASVRSSAKISDQSSRSRAISWMLSEVKLKSLVKTSEAQLASLTNSTTSSSSSTWRTMAKKCGSREDVRMSSSVLDTIESSRTSRLTALNSSTIATSEIDK